MLLSHSSIPFWVITNLQQSPEELTLTSSRGRGLHWLCWHQGQLLAHPEKELVALWWAPSQCWFSSVLLQTLLGSIQFLPTSRRNQVFATRRSQCILWSSGSPHLAALFIFRAPSENSRASRWWGWLSVRDCSAVSIAWFSKVQCILCLERTRMALTRMSQNKITAVTDDIGVQGCLLLVVHLLFK